MIVRQIVGVSDQGVSRPYRCYDENGVLRWCKGNHTGLKSVMSEWVCGRLARCLGLPVPPCDILRLEPKTFESWRRNRGESLPQLVTEANPFVFASTNVENAKDVYDIERDLHCDSPELLARICLFDELVRNTDRTDYNSNLLSNAGVHIIDHNNAFDPGFDPDVFAREHVLRRFRAAADAELVAEFRELVRKTVTEALLDEIWSEMPAEWTDVGEGVLPLDRVKGILLKEVS